MWGQLASAILTNNFDGALELLNALKEQIDNRPSTPQVAQLQQRLWLMHWALFLLGNHPSGKHDRRRPLLPGQVPQRAADELRPPPPLPRRRRRHQPAPPRQGFVRTIGLERHQHSDAVTLFLEDLYVRCDFEAAQARLADCAKLLDSDFFLSNQEEEF